MKEHGVIFSAPMVLALRDRRKTQTRRMATSPLAKRVQVGDQLWVRETVRAVSDDDGFSIVEYAADNMTRGIENSPEAADRWLDLYHYDQKRRPSGPWVPSIHMPRWVSRLALEVTEIREQTLFHIASWDARAEGCPEDVTNPNRWFMELWNSLHTKNGERWIDSPRVVAFSFNVVDL